MGNGHGNLCRGTWPSAPTSCLAHIPAFNAGAVVDTTDAGDAFNGGFAVALAEGRDILQAARFGCAVEGLSVTRPVRRLPSVSRGSGRSTQLIGVALRRLRVTEFGPGLSWTA